MDREQIGKAIRRRRMALGLTLREAAPRCGISFQMLQQVETGRENTTIDRLISIAQGLDSELLVELEASTPEGGEERPLPVERRAISERFANVLPVVPEADLGPFLAMLALWELRYEAPEE